MKHLAIGLVVGWTLLIGAVRADDIDITLAQERRVSATTMVSSVCTVNAKRVYIISNTITDGKPLVSHIIERPSYLDANLLSGYASNVEAGTVTSESVRLTEPSLSLPLENYSILNQTKSQVTTILEHRQGVKTINSSPYRIVLTSLLDLLCWH